MLPVLVALVVGAATAGAATWLARPMDGLTGETPALLGSSTQINWPGGAAGRPAPPRQAPATAPAATTTADTPPPSSVAPPITTTTTVPTTTTTRPAPTTTGPEPLPDPPPAAAAPVDRVVALVNEARVQNGCDPVTVDPRLAEAAAAHSADMAERDYFSHTTPEGKRFDQRIEEAGYPAPGAENIARGQQTADAVMDDWMKSKGHRANILDCRLKTIGVGLTTDGMYWTQDFGY